MSRLLLLDGTGDTGRRLTKNMKKMGAQRGLPLL